MSKSLLTMIKKSHIKNKNIMLETRKISKGTGDYRPAWAGAGFPLTNLGSSNIREGAQRHLAIYLAFMEEYFQDLDVELNVLDVGCGSGHPVASIASLYPNSSFIGVDIVDECIDFCYKYNNEKNCEYVKSDIFKYEEEPFDVIFCIEVYEHFLAKMHKPLMDKMFSLLKPGGLLFISTPNCLGAPDAITEVGHIGLLNIQRAKVFIKDYEKQLISTSFYKKSGMLSIKIEDFITREDMSTFETDVNNKTHFRMVLAK